MDRLSTILTIYILLSGCEDPITIDLPENQNSIVIEGWITNIDQQQIIKISRTRKFDESQPGEIISDAFVSVIQDTITYIFTHQEEGTYLSERNFSGTEGDFFGLQIILSEGDTIRSKTFERMPETVALDSISFDFFEQNSEIEPGQIDRIYFPVTFSSDPFSRSNFYRYVISRNDTVFNTPQDIELLDDRAINGNEFRNEFRTFNYLDGDKVTIELRSINRGAFDFFELLRNQSTSLGTSSGTSPASIDGNLENISDSEQTVLGYFSCFAVSSQERILDTGQ